MAYASDSSSDSSFSGEANYEDLMSAFSRWEDEDELFLCDLVEPKAKPRRWLNSVRRRNCDSAYLELLRELKNYDPSGFQNYVRMSIDSFYHLLELVRPMIEKKVTNWRRPIPAEERLAITLRFLATGELSLVVGKRRILYSQNFNCSFGPLCPFWPFLLTDMMMLRAIHILHNTQNEEGLRQSVIMVWGSR